MDIALMNRRITIQENTVVTDNIGNHTSSWADFYTCWATVSGESGSENEAAGQTVDDTNASFTIRYCEKIKDISTDSYRVKFGDALYDIIGIDHMNYKRKCYKLRCRKVRR